MLRADRAMRLNADKGKDLPKIPALRDLYDNGFAPSEGMLMMIAGRSGSQKSGFAMWLADNWGLDTLYMSLDMQPYMATSRLAAMRMGIPSSSIKAALEYDAAGVSVGREEVLENVAKSKVQFSFGTTTAASIEQQLEAWVEVYNSYPQMIVVDNLMDLEGAETDFSIQSEWMQFLSEITMSTGSTVLVLTHMRETDREHGKEWLPGPRSEIRNKLDQKPRLILSIGLNPHTNAFNVAIVKQTLGKQDSSGSTFATLRAEPEVTRFHAWHESDVKGVSLNGATGKK